MQEREQRFPGIKWYCDRCNSLLSDQTGFDDHHYIWKCTKCGYKNSISATNIIRANKYLRPIGII